MAKASLHRNLRQLPPALAVDSSFVVAAMDESDPSHDQAWRVYRRLVRDEISVAFCPQLLQLEYWHGLRSIRNRLGARQLQTFIDQAHERLTGQGRLELRDWKRMNDRELRELLVGAGDELLEMWLHPLRLVRFGLTRSLLSAARQNVIDWDLRSHDAVVLAVAQSLAASLESDPHLASVDRDFDKVEGLHVWARRS